MAGNKMPKNKFMKNVKVRNRKSMQIWHKTLYAHTTTFVHKNNMYGGERE